MAYIVKNISGHKLPIDGVDLNPNQQLSFATLSAEVIAARDAKPPKVQVKTDETTLEERKSDVEAFKPFKNV
jgi:hypothetical protein